MTPPPTQQCRVGKYGHCNHDIDPANGRPVCENHSASFRSQLDELEQPATAGATTSSANSGFR